MKSNLVKPKKITGIIAVACLLNSCGEDEVESPFAEPTPDVVDFNFDVKPLLSDTCFLCHGPDKANVRKGLSFASYESATSHVTDAGLRALIPGNAEDSEAFMRILSDDENYVMPPPSSNLTLSSRDKEIIRKWIDQGAEYKKHWALLTPEKSLEPEVENQQWANGTIDKFILSAIEEKGLSVSEPADKETLIRRVTFDLTGLPPSLAEIDHFVQDAGENAYETLVDRLLAKPAYGERMTAEWLDVARYADTHGYSTDSYRDASPYRDWVINSFNDNRPFDDFVTWQVAGDMLPNANQEQKLATAFSRLHAQNGEGGIISEEFRVEYVKDRVQTIGTGLLGLTLHCAQCHDHKYDPISTKVYYSTFSFFNNIDDSGQISHDANDIPGPTLLLPTEKQTLEIEKVNNEIRQLELALNRHNVNGDKFRQWLRKDNLSVGTGDDALIDYFPLTLQDSNLSIANKINKEAPGKVLFGSDPKVKDGPVLEHVTTESRQAIKLNGDDALQFPSVNNFDRASPFSVSVDVKLAASFNEGVLLHYNEGGVLYNYKGFDIGIEKGHWLVRLAHTYPFNAIVLRSTMPVEREQWLNVALTYDGSSAAKGVALYINGRAEVMTVERDNLFKDFRRGGGGIKVGARKRSRGVKDALVDNLKIYNRNLTALEIAAGNALEISELDETQLLAGYNQLFNDEYREIFSKLIQLRKQQKDISAPIQELMVMQERTEPRQAYVLTRGSYASQGEPVSPGVPETVFPFDDSWPRNRIGLAKWLTDPKHPLVARVVVNRYWQMMFGAGIVRTPEDFGNQGRLPTHPELLDWLAREFVDSGWDIKHMIKLMVTSTSYQQSSIANPKSKQVDPENTLYSHGPKTRLSAEMIRDNALAVSGLLVDKVGGKSVNPYQPKGIWKINGKEYKQGTGDELYRRSLYTIYKRSAPPPNMTSFDAPMRSHSVGVRQQTSTPLQALALLNDPQIVEASRVLASKVMTETEGHNEQLKIAYRRLTSQQPTAQELEVLGNMYEDLKQSFTANPERAKQFLTVGESPVNENQEPIGLAALGSVVNVLMNHDSVVIKR